MSNEENDKLPPCMIACDPNCEFKKSVVKIENDILISLIAYICIAPLALWKVIELIMWAVK
jgi:hypothetical protein